MDLGIKGKTALVTASSGGMGLNIAQTLAEEGANVVLFARSAEKLDVLAREMSQKYGVQAVAHAGSMLVPEDIRGLAKKLTELGGLDIAILVSARPPNPLRNTVEEIEMARWDEAYRNQLSSIIEITSSILPLMQDRGWGRIVAITSASVKQPMAVHALSTVFRSGVTAYMKSLANELGGQNITVNCVAPALIDTSHRTGASAYSAAQTEHRKSLTPLKRMGSQAELCGVVAFLTSQQAGFITGSTIAVEGGMIGSLY